MGTTEKTKGPKQKGGAGRRPSSAEIDAARIQALALPTSLLVDPSTGAPLPPDEIVVRRAIADDATRGLAAMDPAYLAYGDAIHDPLGDESGVIVEGSLVVDRDNRMRVRVSLESLARLGRGSDVQDRGEDAGEGLHDLAVSVAATLCGERSAKVMRVLYLFANDQGRTGRVVTTLNELLDKLDYAKDERGIHRHKNRVAVSQALLALQYAQVGLSIATADGGGVGVIAPLLASLEYRTRERVSDLSPQQVFERGLPDQIVVSINRPWYRLRDDAGRMTNQIALVPRSSLLPGGGTYYRQRRATTSGSLAAYIASIRAAVPLDSITIERRALILQSGIIDQRRSTANRTLTRALDKLVAGGKLVSFEPNPLPLANDAPVILRLPLARPLALPFGD